MSGEPRKSTKAQLALALARGISVRIWARDSEVPKRTAYRWAKEPEVRKAVVAYRHRMIDQAIGRMATRTTWATNGIAKIAQTSDFDSVRLRAFRSIFSDMIAFSNHSGLDARMTELEEEVHAKVGNKGAAP
jgi:hypothetical protein